jgi:Flp pilus assembly protein TadD
MMRRSLYNQTESAMKRLHIKFFAAMLVAGFAVTAANAIDTIQTSDAPDLAAVRVKIKAKDWKGAVADLNALVDKGVQHADVYNLLGFSLRNQGDNRQAQTYYMKALDFDPDHKGALEYQGELYVKIGDYAKARANLARLVKLCPSGCEEREDLEKALVAAAPAQTQ